MTCACPDFSGLQAQVNLIRNGGFEEETTDTCGANSFTTNYCPIKYWYQHKGSSPEVVLMLELLLMKMEALHLKNF